MPFYEGDLQSGIASAIQQQKAVLCFVQDASDKSAEWEEALKKEPIAEYIQDQAVAMKLQAGSSEAGFLTPICPINNVPAVVVIKNAALQANIQDVEDTEATLTAKLEQLFGPPETDQTSTPAASEQVSEPTTEPAIQPATASSVRPGLGYIDLPSSAGQPRLPNNAYDALREFTEGLKESGEPPEKIRAAQIGVLSRLPIFKDEVRRLQSLGPDTPLELSQTARDRLMLRLPAAAIKAQMKVQSNAPSRAAGTPPAPGRVYPSQPVRSTPTSQRSTEPAPAPEAPELSAAQRAQQNEYRQMQRDREQKQRDERERIKAQIKADKEERRRRDLVQKQNEAAASTTSASGETSTNTSTSTATKPRSSDLRVQVRTFDGSVLREVFKPSSTITGDLRPWIDGTIESTVPYDFKLILTPQPNKKIEAAEEELALSDLGIQSSCTFVIAPVQGYVESYSGASGGIVGSAISGSYNLVTGTAGALYGGVRSILGYGQQAASDSNTTGSQGQADDGSAAAGQRSMRVRTLADQRAEEAARKNNQFYNGNTLNFEPNKKDDDDSSRKND